VAALTAAPSSDLSSETARPVVLLVSVDAKRIARLSYAVSRATNSNADVVVRDTTPSALEVIRQGVHLCLFDLSDPARLDLGACRSVIAATGTRPVIVVAPEHLAPLATQAVDGGAFEFQLLDAGSSKDLESAMRRALVDAPEPVPVAKPRPRTAIGTVLLVEDDDVLRTTYVDLLAEQGWTVIGAADGFNALLRASSHRGRIDLMISDVILPKMSGVELWRKLSRFRPEARVLFITGNLDQARALVGRGEDAPHLLAKPFTPTALLDTVRALLAESPFTRELPPEPA
jgi:DNA-binding response OmpR family regulator